jgi:hypothetical protein
VYILSLVFAEQKGSCDVAPVLLNEREEEDSEPRRDAMLETGSLMEMTDFFGSELSPEESALAEELMQMLNE